MRKIRKGALVQLRPDDPEIQRILEWENHPSFSRCYMARRPTTPEDRQEDKEANQAEKSEKSEQEATDEKSLAQQASDNKAQETQQKHKQLLNKVTDDPYLLLRNKMRLEYQKRRHHSAPQGEKKKW